jgi:hypothetical protein
MARRVPSPNRYGSNFTNILRNDSVVRLLASSRPHNDGVITIVVPVNAAHRQAEKIAQGHPGAISASSSVRSLFATLQQPRRFHPIRPCRECRRRAAPAQCLGIVEERRIGAQRCEILEEQCEIAPFAENV